jgi:hypothetical protein
MLFFVSKEGLVSQLLHGGFLDGSRLQRTEEERVGDRWRLAFSERRLYVDWIEER